MLYSDKLRTVFETLRSRAVMVARSRNEHDVADEELKSSFDRETLYKVPFLHALELIRHREVFLAGGYAFVPGSRVVSILVGRFRAYISRGLNEAKKALPDVEADERLAPMLRNISKSYVGPEYGAGRKVREQR